MPRKLAIMIPWQFEMRRQDAIDLARIADQAGVHSFWVPEGWGRDAFSLLVSLAEKTERIQLATGIVNVYSRTPGALAQHAATLDEWSDGRAILGLGASSANVIEQFHGIRFQPSLARVRETVAIVRMLLRGEPLVHHGTWFNMDRGFTLRMQRVRPEIPIFLATLNPKSVKMTAEIADGWIPAMVPHGAMAGEIAQLRAWAREAGRDPAKLSVKAGNVTVSERPEARDLGRAFIAYYIARMGTFYYNQLVRFGFEEDAALVKRTFEEQGSAAAAAAIPLRLVSELGFAGSAEACRDRILEQEKQGVDIHGITIDAREPREFARTVATLLR
jgi:alkanesulfonate monooxygenase SsuD/methylene tetrahydromethanopterin reductase-like flavin-dependent oxidoreductase (luciferase family)